MSIMIIEHGDYSDFMYHVVAAPDGVTSADIQAEWEKYKIDHDWESRLDDLHEGEPGDCYSDLCRWIKQYHPEIKSHGIPVVRE